MRKYKNAKVFTDDIEDYAWEQVIEISDQDFMKNSKIRIMPDCHGGTGCVVGFTANFLDKIVPNLVGVDIGCGIRCVEISDHDIDLEKLDDVVHKYVPSGFSVRSTKAENLNLVGNLDSLTISDCPINWNRINLSLGTLGGGNHFIELDKGKNSYYLVVHSGSRNLGVQVAKYHQSKAIEQCKNNKYELSKIINDLKSQKRFKEIESTIKNYKESHISPKNELCYVSGYDMNAYLNDMRIAQRFAYYNRKTMLDIIMDHMGWSELSSFDSIHNYIDLDHMIIRKGATPAYKGQKLIIPLNMRDGSIIGVGKGNEDWNYSAPHGAGRCMSRTQARNELSIDDYVNTMSGVYSTSVNPTTIDEAPMAYKPSQEIIDLVRDTIDIQEIIKPVYNFKANGKLEV